MFRECATSLLVVEDLHCWESMKPGVHGNITVRQIADTREAILTMGE